jgi:hypothetical protein
MSDPSAIETALAAACEFAIAHGVEGPIHPDDFGIQSADGLTNATYVDSGHAVTVFVDRDGHASFGVAELDWLHDDGDHDRDICDYCEVIDPCEFVDVYLPGDAPEAAANGLEVPDGL